ncbi:uncharacterized protein LOC128892969 [Hylaeus anthracinus]|uniref:uncharacterized protein LOC128892969 n=1 Tax=Hylaeus anthracinus TaxID=313031 RepID=UPI0023B97DD9|nr:uncharacterized protein LOC128892969 [Hylaeus anthracinus]
MKKKNGKEKEPISGPEERPSAPLASGRLRLRRKSVEQAVENEYSDENRNARKKLKIIGSEKTNIVVNPYKSKVENIEIKNTNVRSIVESIDSRGDNTKIPKRRRQQI